ncbi:hypothetical protein COLO4_30456 [Corchorus olitorius]|uniref:Uncharacterized protein n=1 Tax=Corchorus olitorius TaxID=93759 RepID=A0A1R3H8K6_9ROSI|nr:hypothetical protein COLO4_30456 [Corchorus olitorius]
MVMTPRLGFDREIEAGLREANHSLRPEKSPETLAAAGKEERKLFTVRAAVGCDNICALNATLDAAAVATSIDGYYAATSCVSGTEKERRREQRSEVISGSNPVRNMERVRVNPIPSYLISSFVLN